jgi:hypothetical protein
MTLSDVETDLTSDGKGEYRDGVCGVIAYTIPDVEPGFHMSPAGGSIPKSQTAACAGIAPRAATLRLGLQHLSSTPHVDDPAPAIGGSFPLGNLASSPLGATKINSGGGVCFHVDRRGSLSGRGLRFDPVNYPGSNSLIRDNLGGGQYHIYSAAYPDNIAYCEGDTGITFWHVVVDLNIQVLNP